MSWRTERMHTRGLHAQKAPGRGGGRRERGQATVEAAFAIPVLFVMLLMLVQPGIVLYDRMVMAHAAAEGCRLLATRSAATGMTDERCIQLVKRQLSAIPPHELFHVHDPACSWEVDVEGDETAEVVRVSIANELRLLPLFDAAGALTGLADAQGHIRVQVSCAFATQPEWVRESKGGINPPGWVSARKEE